MKALRSLVARWVEDESVVVTGMWPLLGEVLVAEWADDVLKQAAVDAARRQAPGIGSSAKEFFDSLSRALPEWQARVFPAFIHHRAATKRLSGLARSSRHALDVRRTALRALAKATEAPSLLALVEKLQHEQGLAAAAQEVLAAFAARRSSRLEDIANLSTGDVLRDRGRAVKIDRILDLGVVDFGASTLEFWDPIQVEPLGLTVKVPARRARVFAALSGQWARSWKIRFASAEVARWRRIGEASSRFATVVASRRGVRAELSKVEFETSFWDEVFDEAFDPSEGAAIVELQVGDESVPLLAWNDSQMGGTLFAGHDARGELVALLFDGVRISPEA